MKYPVTSYHNTLMVKHVPSSDFDLSGLRAEEARYKRLRKMGHHIMWAILLSLTALSIDVHFDQGDIIAISISWLSAICGALAGFLVIRLNDIIEKLEPQDLWWKIIHAEKLARLMLTFDDRDAAWCLQSDMFAVIEDWCRKNGVRCTIGDRSDPMGGYYGMLVSFEDEGDYVLFKLKWLGR